MPDKRFYFLFVILLPMVFKGFKQLNTTEKVKIYSYERVATNRPCDITFVSASHDHFSLNLSTRYM